jgi:hypothetical protein
LENLKAITDSAVVVVSDLPEAALRELQEALGVTVDGKFGNQTFRAWRKFKESHNLGDLELIGRGSFELLAREVLPRGGAAKEAAAAASNNVSVESPKDLGASRMWPGRGAVYVNAPITKLGNFTYAEFTKDGTRWPYTEYHADNIVRIAEV